MIQRLLKEKFDTYRKWFSALVVEHFVNLPFEAQERFLVLVKKLEKDCREVHEDARNIKEKVIKISVSSVSEGVVTGTTEESGETVKFETNQKVIPGTKINYIVYSLDGGVWYSSKKELITGRR